jgi:hypothetical protein
MSVPRWLRSLISSGDPQSLAYRQYVRLVICPRCMDLVFAAREHYPQGRDVLAGLEPLNSLGEAWALSRKYETYRMYGNSLGFAELCLRTKWDIVFEPTASVAPSGTVVRVVMQHVCGLLLPSVYGEDAELS